MQIYYFDFLPPNSFDPLEADRTINLNQARMMYLTPLEISIDNSLVSTILSDFSYSKSTSTIEFVVNESLKFDNGQSITVKDVAFSIVRMIYTHPTFPVLEYIDGVELWLKNKFPLKTYPLGLKVKNNAISIKLNRDVDNPLFRFVLELFSIIPENCVNKETNKLICTKPPESGYYKLTKSDSNKLFFTKRFESSVQKIKLPSRITFNYIKPDNINKNIYNIFDENSVLFGTEFSLFSNEITFLKNDLYFKYLPATMFLGLVFNIEGPPFSDNNFRKMFAHHFRFATAEFTNENLNFMWSIFPPIIPGHIPNDLLVSKSSIDSKDFNQSILLGNLQGRPLSLGLKIAVKTLEKLNIKYKIVEFQSSTEMEKAFLVNKINLTFFGSGFWALDPVGDIKMLFTPKLHPLLNFVTSDETLQKKMVGVDQFDGENLSERLKQINQHLFENSRYSVFLSTRRFYAAKNKKILRELAQGVSSPAPWQIFNTEIVDE